MCTYDSMFQGQILTYTVVFHVLTLQEPCRISTSHMCLVKKKSLQKLYYIKLPIQFHCHFYCCRLNIHICLQDVVIYKTV